MLDIHTHHNAPQSEGVISCNPSELPPENSFPGQAYSVGIHPWNLSATGLTPEDIDTLKAAAGRSDVVAIGECGIDLARPGCPPLFAQMNALKTHVELSESLKKPMVLHCVKAHDIIIGMRKDLQPSQPWIVHGFRGKPTILTMLLNAGISVSFGEKFNPESLVNAPLEAIFAETDESQLSITEIIANLHQSRPEITEELIRKNTGEFLRI